MTTNKTKPHFLVPRKYQIEVLNAALKKNVIAFLDTGSGKTLIATELIKHYLKEYPLNEHKIVFIVDKLTLAIQQTNFIKHQVPVRVNVLYGDLGVDYWSEEQWKNELSAKILVFTSQVFLNLLRSHIFDFGDVRLLIFDEVHHASKKHPFKMIFEEFYFLSRFKDRRPKIFGMTASPAKIGGYSPSVLFVEIIKLSKITDSQIIFPEKYYLEMAKNNPKPNEYVLEYNSSNDSRYIW
ncbi:endoribonuclease dicer [Anaeramoeba flamelloides]|uniref:Endoribonuclease dicer n=1 Tax=Anaeramoeba flamelloides TaxID=1746091 RepID=A0AAV8AGD5_9EUKA|nr:endoribonuclease dicer [Anaeramoeba flamelloides]